MNGIGPYLSLIPVAALIFQAGKQSEKLDELFTKTFALEKEQRGSLDILHDIDIKVTTVQHDVKQMQEILMGRDK
jgi:hypothetical protein